MLRRFAQAIIRGFTQEGRLLRLLAIAEARFHALGTGPIWSSYESGVALANFVAHARARITDGTISQTEKSELWGIFAPTCDWDDTVGDVRLGNEIFAILDSLYRRNVHFPIPPSETGA